MTILVVEHHDKNSIGVVGDTFDTHKIDTQVVWAQRGDPIPENPNGYTGLVLLGGAMNVLDDDQYPYFPTLVRLIRQFGENDIPVLGICHGAQMIARAYGAEVKLGGPLEFGFHDIMPTGVGVEDPVLGHMKPIHGLFEWHTDHYALPDGAVQLATGNDYPNQAYRIGRATYATQFHFEADRSLIDSWIDSHMDTEDWAPGYKEWLPVQFEQHLEPSKAFCMEMTRRWLDLRK